ncbi:class F sortase [Streptomyces niveus]
MTLTLMTCAVRSCAGPEAEPPRAGSPPASAAPLDRASDDRTRHDRTSPKSPRRETPALVRSPPVELAVPAISIEAPVVGLGLDREGRLDTPPLSRPRQVSWYREGPTPGEPGAALIVGHRDTRTGPAVFLNLNALKPGNVVNVRRADRRTAVFTVDDVRTYKKEAFPDDKVYGSTKRPELRLLTCGGAFDPKSGYSANVVVFAHLTDVRRV